MTIIRDDELMHYGVLGMKWGVRRYQNKDGTLTNLGRKRLSGLIGYDIPKGSVVFRAVRNGSTRFMDREYTYVNATDKYYEHSYETSSGFDSAFDTDYKLKTTRNLHIASTNDYFNALMKSNGIDPNQYLSKCPKDIVEKGKYIIENGLLEHKYIEGSHGTYEAFNNAVKYLQKQGYDGVVDPIDGARQERDTGKPIATVVFDPGKNLEITRTIEI